MKLLLEKWNKYLKEQRPPEPEDPGHHGQPHIPSRQGIPLSDIQRAQSAKISLTLNAAEFGSVLAFLHKEIVETLNIPFKIFVGDDVDLSAKLTMHGTDIPVLYVVILAINAAGYGGKYKRKGLTFKIGKNKPYLNITKLSRPEKIPDTIEYDDSEVPRSTYYGPSTTQPDKQPQPQRRAREDVSRTDRRPQEKTEIDPSGAGAQKKYLYQGVYIMQPPKEADRCIKYPEAYKDCFCSLVSQKVPGALKLLRKNPNLCKK